MLKRQGISVSPRFPRYREAGMIRNPRELLFEFIHDFPGRAARMRSSVPAAGQGLPVFILATLRESMQKPSFFAKKNQKA
jgi:hypothetical protein